MRTLFSIGLCVALMPLGVRLVGAAETAQEILEQKALERLVGNWDNAYKLQKSDWTPNETTGTAKVTATRILGGRFIQEISEQSDKTSTMRLLTYDLAKKSLRGWWFSSDGHTAEHTGTWNDDAKTMTWKSVGNAGATTTVISRFVDEDHVTWDVIVTDAAGKTVFRMDGTSARVKPKAKP